MDRMERTVLVGCLLALACGCGRATDGDEGADGGADAASDADTDTDTDTDSDADWGEISGTITLETYVDTGGDPYTETTPVSGAEITAVDEQSSDSFGPAESGTDGVYVLPVPDGTYTVTAGCDADSQSASGVVVPANGTTIQDFTFDGGTIDAPYVYLYPETTTDVRVTLQPAPGTAIEHSEPEYGDGWEVTADPSGRLDGAWDYLFYEASVYWVFQEEQGFAVPGDEIFGWFAAALPGLGLNAEETQDFLDYWTVNLPEAPCYLIYPQPVERVDLTMGLTIEPAPDSLLRLWLVVRGADDCVAPAPWEAAPFERAGFTAVEWGVAFDPR
jgi:hypothetical protein